MPAPKVLATPERHPAVGDASHTEPWDPGTAEIYASDNFRMYVFKVLCCSNRVRHDWKCCPFAHPGEHARRRPLDKFTYDAELCAFARRGAACPKGDLCPHSHHVFEMYLHPARYKTQLCVDGAKCRRKVCFFAHGLHDLRAPPTAAAEAPPPPQLLPPAPAPLAVCSWPAAPLALPSAPSASAPSLVLLPSNGSNGSLAATAASAASAQLSPPPSPPASGSWLASEATAFGGGGGGGGAAPPADSAALLQALLREAEAGGRAAAEAAEAARRADAAAADATSRALAFARRLGWSLAGAPHAAVPEAACSPPPPLSPRALDAASLSALLTGGGGGGGSPEGSSEWNVLPVLNFSSPAPLADSPAGAADWAWPEGAPLWPQRTLSGASAAALAPGLGGAGDDTWASACGAGPSVAPLFVAQAW